MNNRAFTISLVLALMAVFMVYSYITSKEEEIKGKFGTPESVLVAKTDITELSEIHENMIEIVSKPKKFMEPGKTSNKQEVIGFIASVPIRKGEQITLNKIVAPGLRTGISKQVSPGKRAVSIPVDQMTGVNKLLKPGDRVDVMVAVDPPGASRGNTIGKIMFQDVPILAVGNYVVTQAPRTIEKNDEGKEVVRNLNIDTAFNSVVIELEPQSAFQMALMRDSGAARVSLLLRNNDDTERVGFQTTNMSEVLSSDPNKIYRGSAGQK
jgi:pilus assembly protein CpaB